MASIEHTIRLHAPEGWQDTIVLRRHFGQRDDDETEQTLVQIQLTTGEDGEGTDAQWLSVDESRRLARLLLELVGEEDELAALRAAQARDKAVLAAVNEWDEARHAYLICDMPRGDLVDRWDRARVQLGKAVDARRAAPPAEHQKGEQL